MLGRLAAQQRTAGDHAAVGDTGDDLADPLRDGSPDGDVVLQEQRFGSAHHQVVDHHRDQVQAHGVVLVHGLGHRKFGAHPIGGGGQYRLSVASPEREQAREAA